MANHRMPDWPRYLVVPLITLGGAVKLLQKKDLIARKTGIADSRRRVLHLSESAQLTYAAIIKSFVEREKQMLETLDPAERRELVRLFGKIIAAADAWAKPY